MSGLTKGVDISLMAYVSSTGVGGVLMNARKQIHCEFTGKSDYTRDNPWEGVNALSTLVISYNNIAVLRQQF
ncbi:hypothetical protein AFLA70_213g001610 [Aspergillus flavus AF70]|nr:hypothetical protein AFLA70_213g001610 [Aspergillus flavus AF70]